MIPFFRKIRKKLVDDNRPLKYMRYAIGEIVLVMVGILLALQVNNWNEKRKNLKVFHSMMQSLEQDLAMNIGNATTSIEFGFKKDSLMTLLYKKVVTPEMYFNNKDFMGLNNNFHSYFIIENNIEKLIAFENNIPKKYNPIITSLKIYKNQIDRYKNYWERTKDEIYGFINHQGYNATYTNKDEFLAYVFNNIAFKRKTSRIVNLMVGGNVWHGSKLKTNAITIMLQIKLIRDQYTAQQLHQYMNSIGMNNFEEIDCNSLSVSEDPRKGLFFTFVLMNLKKKPITLYKIDSKANNDELIILEPNEIKFGKYQSRLKIGDIFILKDSANCSRKLIAPRFGYLLVE